MSRHQLTPDQSRRVREIAIEAANCPSGDRRCFVEKAAAGDLQIAEEVLSILEHADGDDDFLWATAALPRTVAVERSAAGDSLVGQVIERYRIDRAIGEGGFGTVYEAWQQHPVQRRVALKVIKPGMDSRQIIERFEAERQTLAMMTHPNIATVLDGGTTSSAHPYFVMEYVEGVPITSYCDAAHLTAESRVRLFIDVCRAVQHAHVKGIIHRDLKPSNVLVTVQDDVPIPKVIDFGIAKATGGEIEQAARTGRHQLIGTPAYMSPEQARADVDIDTRSDVYSLGVLLYELLTGVTPFDRNALRNAGPTDLQRMICSQEPPRPSTRVRRLDPTALDDIAAWRSTDQVELRRRLRGDLDWIVMRAMEKDREYRYDTAAALADDLQRHLVDEPVLASPPSAVYRLRKLVRRNRGVFAAGAVVFAVLLIGAAGTTLGMIRAIDESERATHEMIRAREIKNVVTEMLGSFDTKFMTGDQVQSMRAILAETVSRIAFDRIEDPIIEAETRAVIVSIYARLGMFDDAEAHVTQLQSSVLRRGEAHPALAAAHHSVGELRYRQGRFEDARIAFFEAMQVRNAVLGPDHPDTLSSMVQLGRSQHRLRRFDEARSTLLAAVDGRTRTLGPEDPNTLIAMNYLALTEEQRGNPQRTREIYEHVLGARGRTLGAEHPGTLNSAMRLAMLLDRLGEHDAATGHAQAAADGLIRVWGIEHPDVMIACEAAGAVLLHADRSIEALEILAPVEPIARLTLSQRRLGEFLSKLGRAHLDAGDAGAAEPLLLEAHALLDGAAAGTDEGLAASRTVDALIGLYAAQGRAAEAEAWRQQRSEP